jgi:hypothetical protein
LAFAAATARDRASEVAAALALAVARFLAVARARERARDRAKDVAFFLLVLVALAAATARAVRRIVAVPRYPSWTADRVTVEVALALFFAVTVYRRAASALGATSVDINKAPTTSRTTRVAPPAQRRLTAVCMVFSLCCGTTPNALRVTRALWRPPNHHMRTLSRFQSGL